MKPSPVAARAAIGTDETLGDLRFRALIADDDWATLPIQIRRRFSRRLADGNTAVYVGEILETRTNMAGWLLAHAARLIGSPFPVGRDTHVPHHERHGGHADGGQIWTRLYAPPLSANRPPSSGLPVQPGSEHVGHGVGMTRYGVKDDALVFRSRDYFVNSSGCASGCRPGHSRADGDPRRMC